MKKIYLFLLFLLVFSLISYSSYVYVNSFTNGLTEENITLQAGVNITRYINITSSDYNVTQISLSVKYNYSLYRECIQKSPSYKSIYGEEISNCGLNYSGNITEYGTYSDDGYLWYFPISNMFDNNSNTFAWCRSAGPSHFSDAQVNLTYIKPIGALNSSYISLSTRTSAFSDGYYRNFTIPNACWNYLQNSIIFKFYSSSLSVYGDYYCYNGTDFYRFLDCENNLSTDCSSQNYNFQINWNVSQQIQNLTLYSNSQIIYNNNSKWNGSFVNEQIYLNTTPINQINNVIKDISFLSYFNGILELSNINITLNDIVAPKINNYNLTNFTFKNEYILNELGSSCVLGLYPPPALLGCSWDSSSYGCSNGYNIKDVSSRDCELQLCNYFIVFDASACLNKTFYTKDTNITFVFNSTDGINISNIIFSTNYSRQWVNYSNLILNQNNITYFYLNITNITDLLTFNYLWYVNDTNNNFNQTTIQTVSIYHNKPIITPSILNKPIQVTDNITATFTYYDLDNDTYLSNSTKWYLNYVYNSSFNNLTKILSGNLSQGQIWTFSAQICDKFNCSLWINDSVTINDSQAPIIYNWSVSSIAPYITDSILFNISANDTDSILEMTSSDCILGFYKSDLGTPYFNVTTDSKSGLYFSKSLSMSSYGLGILQWKNVYCYDVSGNLRTNITNINITISSVPVIAPPSGGGGGGSSPKKLCDITISPKELTFFTSDIVKSIRITNNELSSISPTYSVNTKYFTTRGAKDVLQAGQEFELSIVKVTKENVDTSETLIISSLQCSDIIIPLYLTTDTTKLSQGIINTLIAVFTGTIKIGNFYVWAWIILLMVVIGIILLINTANITTMQKIVADIFLITFIEIMVAYTMYPYLTQEKNTFNIINIFNELSTQVNGIYIFLGIFLSLSLLITGLVMFFYKKKR